MSDRFTIATFNLQYGQVWDSEDPDNAPYDLDRAIAEVAQLDADIVLIQEMEKVDPARGQIQPPPNFSRLKAALPQYEAIFSYPPEDERELPFGYGQAILSKAPITDVEAIALPAPKLTFDFMGEESAPTDRLMLAARTVVAGREIQLFNAHLQAFFIIDYSSDDFRCQRDVVEARLRGSTLPTILAGDMNSAPGEHLVEQFAKAGFRTAQRSKITWKRMPYVLDHIFVNEAFEVEEVQIVATDAADHDILAAQLRFRD